MTDERTFLAFDRTLLAWVRTSTSLLTFGFGIYKLLSQQATEPGKHPVLELVSPRIIGIAMILSAFLGLIFAVMGYIRFMLKNEKRGMDAYASPALLQAYVVLALCALILTGALIGG
jgi:putative membrane protein